VATLAEISAQLNEIKQIKTDIKSAINTNEVLITEDTPFSEYASKINQSITVYNIDNLIGELNANGELLAPTEKVLSFAGITTINNLQHRFWEAKLSKILFSGVTNITGDNSDAFFGNRNITSLSFPSLTDISGNCARMFWACSSLQSVYFPSLINISGNCTEMFNSCSSLQTVYFPGLTSVQTDSLKYAFSNCSLLTEIHFRADMQATIETLTGYDSKFGATNAIIYFDL
jgi:hypothetical protein